MAPPKEKWIRRFVISETSRHTKDFTIYKVTSLMFLKRSPDIISKVSIWKRYSEFKKLHSTLQVLHSTLQIKEPFPLFPKPKFFGRFETEVIEERKECALKLLEFIGRYNALYTSDVFVKFFENDRLNKQSVDCSYSLSSDTSEDDKTTNYDTIENTFSSTTDLPKFVCTKKMIPIVVKNKIDIQANNINSKSINRKSTVITNKYEQNKISCNINNTKNNLSDIADESSTLICKENDLKNGINNFSVIIHDGSDLTHTIEKDAQYILIAAAHMSAAFRHEAIAEYEEAFTQYKLGISHLINGIQTEVDQGKKTKIQHKITKYLHRAEKLYNRHLNCNISVLLKPVTELRNYKVIDLKESMMVVKDILQGFKRVIKTVEKVDGSQKNNSYILRGKVPYMVQLYSCVQTDSTVFLILQYMRNGKLWDFIKSNYKPDERKYSFQKRKHSRSFSCNAIIQNNLLACTQEKHPETQFINKEKNSLIPIKNDIVSGDTKELVENAQKLLESVNATLKRSNSIAGKLNESESFLYNKQHANNKISNGIFDWKNNSEQNILCTEENVGKQKIDLTGLFVNDNCKEFNNDKCEQVYTKNKNISKHNIKTLKIGNVIQLTNASLVNIPITEKSWNKMSFNIFENRSQLKKGDNYSIEIEKQMWIISESDVKIWAAEILLTLEALHQQDVIISNLRPDNILIDDYGNVSMTYIVPHRNIELLNLKKPYSSPELCMFTPPISISTSADVWSFGVLLYELLTGYDFQMKHPGQFHSHSLVNIPNNLSDHAKSLLFNILKYKPSDRLTIPEIKQHSFFIGIVWLELLNAQI
ncbi:PREDICTED: ribosomal protein S6 kinase delta-1 [Ceratosolen solmsi marchali]|uniref:Ribosomal protein S6 kinase delta-1 n=1 Tax=Ceratosolen solmsi marchali TaxID=326594 RepID=A0AAJ6YDQ4_9HYME|nr:PREDICTED: ribosomal protein S6 kinase delta-1 [Ceratosolen solmsi marchali]XP_011496176.1 PREDICTED: ribosomal protein S6 kinase delta-1 [Ceratosolen solmsi marchali]